MGCCHIYKEEKVFPIMKKATNNIMDFSNLLSTTPDSGKRSYHCPEHRLMISEMNIHPGKQGCEYEIGDEEIINEFKLKTLVLSVIDSKSLPKNYKITLTPTSINSKRINTGESFIFGKNNEKNDFVFPENENVGNKQFEISYQNDSNIYSIKDFRQGTGVFIKIEKYLLNKDMVFSFYNTHILVNKIKSDNILKIKIMSGSLKDKIFTFNTLFKKKVILGRNKDADIFINDENISRVQITFSFKDKKWFIYDGCPEKPSRNGLWILATHSIPITNNMLLKTGYTTFQASLL